jgi:hypothetical protein
MASNETHTAGAEQINPRADVVREHIAILRQLQAPAETLRVAEAVSVRLGDRDSLQVHDRPSFEK